ncbi:MAG: BMP family protein [Roseiflexaceae bacterium]|jgi:simple sugar transport system substrate-binding protein
MKQLVNGRSVRVILFTLVATLSLILSACGATATAPATDEKFVFGMVLVGPFNDGGWSQAHYDAGKYIESKISGSEMVYVDKVNPADRPNVKVEQVVDELVAKGAKLIITTSDDFKDGTREAAKAHPDVTFMHASGDDVITGKAPANLGNTMGRMEYGKMIAGCAAALQTKTGNISFIGPLINDETRRLANSAYLGAKHCWTNVLGNDPAAMQFNVTWIGFWFNIPGVTLDPTKVVNDFFAAGSDVVISGIDTPEAIIEAAKARAAGKDVYALPYDFKEACAKGEDACLGVPYFNWVPAYTKIINDVKAGTWKQGWEWFAPEWSDINNVEKSGIGFNKGKALSADNAAKLDAFIVELAGGLNLWTGPIVLQDGSEYLAAGVVATDEQIWYMPQLLDGMTGQSVSEPSN